MFINTINIACLEPHIRRNLALTKWLFHHSATSVSRDFIYQKRGDNGHERMKETKIDGMTPKKAKHKKRCYKNRIL